MDHWGDPWADNANDKLPTKNAVTSPLPPAFTFAPAPLGGFVDDAGWGNNDDDGFGDWAASDTGNAVLKDVVTTPAGGADPGIADWDTVTHEERQDISPRWLEPATDAPQTLETVDSEPSDSSTVSYLDESAIQEAVEEHVQPQMDLEFSVRSSTSPSETSRNDLPIESPRTSVEEERAVHKDALPSKPLTSAAAAHTNVADSGPDSSHELIPKSAVLEKETDVKDSKALDNVDEHTAGAGDTDHTLSDVSDDHSAPHGAGNLKMTPDGSAAAPAAQPHALPNTFVCDNALFAQLFPSGEQTEKQLNEHNDPIFTTSARKAWYRLTRKQTMREFNHGENDDNYIRVTWTNSHVRAEVHKVVSRWAREDRISGTGPGARASFYWDTPAPAESEVPFGHSRTQSSVPATKTALPARQSLPPLASNQSAAFNWSSSASTDHWKLDSPSQRSTSAPLAPKNPIVAKLQRQEDRAVSVDLTPRKSEQAMHKRTATVSHTASETNNVANHISPGVQPSAEILILPGMLDKPDSFPAPDIETTNIPVDDDDEWGEMVQTPTLPTPQQLDLFSQPLEPSTIVPLSSLPSSDIFAPTGDEAGPIEPMYAAPIVRLRSTISPTSALFKTNTFVPLNAEHGPIGPGILKPANRSTHSVSDRKLDVTVPEEAVIGSSGSATILLKADESREDSEDFPRIRPDPSLSTDALEPVEQVATEATSTEATSTESTSTEAAQPSIPPQAAVDAWADADFSFFETTQPASAPQTVQTHD